jgi:signal transduction histidine kinase
LGLSLSYDIVKVLGGETQNNRVQCKGAEFKIILQNDNLQKQKLNWVLIKCFQIAGGR